MAYFSNATEAMIWMETNCEVCLRDVVDCPVSIIQDMYNYAQHDNPELKTAMDYLVPTRDDGFAGQCAMLIE